MGICRGSSGDYVIFACLDLRSRTEDNVGGCVSLTQQHRGHQPQSEWILSPRCGGWRTQSKKKSKSLMIIRHICLYLSDKITIKSLELYFKCQLQIMGNYRLRSALNVWFVSSREATVAVHFWGFTVVFGKYDLNLNILCCKTVTKLLVCPLHHPWRIISINIYVSDHRVSFFCFVF